MRALTGLWRESHGPLSKHHPKLLGIVGLCLLSAKKIRIQDSVSTDIAVNSFMPGLNYILLARLQEQSLSFLNIIILNFTTMVFYFLQKLIEICVRFPICLVASLGVGIHISEVQCRRPFLDFVGSTRFLRVVFNNYSICFCRNILKDPNFDFSPCGLL